jgi:hypothetical protein
MWFVMRNPTRRNRNIGTEKQGYGQNNRMVIPESWQDSRDYREKLKDPVVIRRTLHGRLLTFMVEPPRADCFHPCTVDDVMKVLSCLPAEDTDGIEVFLMRQPTRKQQKLCPVWGRFLYYAEPTPKINGSTICLEAQEHLSILKWNRSLDIEDQVELERLAQDGHHLEYGTRNVTIQCSPESQRNTLLYRTVIHELGHYVDWITTVNGPSEPAYAQSQEERERDFQGQNHTIKESFANRYADHHRERLRKEKRIPFPPIFNREQMLKDRLDPNWFLPPDCRVEVL